MEEVDMSKMLTLEPEQIHALQMIFDAVWTEAQANAAAIFQGPPNAEGLREEIARRVLTIAEDDQMTQEQIVQTVLESFGVRV
jgi:hypothetical protein